MERKEKLDYNVKIFLDSGYVIEAYMYFTMIDNPGETCAVETARILSTDGRLMEVARSRIMMIELQCSGFRELSEIVRQYVQEADEFDDMIEYDTDDLITDTADFMSQ